ncbi:MAG: type III pantothenate kinase [Porphyromonadaceae bacterium]|nr:type III pantothenate kinase [Porphyromonadaceae bacterium]
MTNLVIDIGNTRTKVAVFENNQMIDFFAAELVTLPLLKDFLRKYCIDNSIISSVSFSKREIVYYLENNSNFIEFNAQTYKGLKINYETHQTLGKDRIASAIGAIEVMPNSNLLVIDIGSCITFDLITKDSTFHGGNIAPGYYMRLKAMHDYTAKLPIVTQQIPKELIGKNTKEAVLFGAYWGIVFEINSFAEYLREKYPDIKVILTGGDAHYFENSIKQCTFANSNLVLIGLNKVIESIIN